MANDVLNALLREYEQKKLRAEIDLNNRKDNLFSLIPRLKEIEDELNNFAIQSTKKILNNSNTTKITVDELKNKINLLKKEKESILLNNNYSLDFLKPFYECQLCDDTGFVVDENFNTTMCSCLKQKLLDISINKSNIYNLKNENFDSFNETLFSDKANINKYKFKVSPRDNILEIKKKCIDFIANFDNPETKNLLFIGSTGLR